jgi:hypothetical protein
MFAQDLSIYIWIPTLLFVNEMRDKIVRMPQIFNLQSSFFISGVAGLGFWCREPDDRSQATDDRSQATDDRSQATDVR